MHNASTYSLVIIRSLWRHHLSTASPLIHTSQPNKKQTRRLHFITSLSKLVEITTALKHHSAATYNETELTPIAPPPQGSLFSLSSRHGEVTDGAYGISKENISSEKTLSHSASTTKLILRPNKRPVPIYFLFPYLHVQTTADARTA